MISVLGIVSSVVVFAVGGVSDRGQDAACATDAGVLHTAEAANKAQFGGYGTESDLVAHALLSEESVLHDIELKDQDYTLVKTGACAPVVTTTTAPPVTTTVPPTTTTLGAGAGSGGASGVTVRLLDSAGNGLAGASVAYLQSWWSGMPNTGNDGTSNANLSAGTYTFSVDYRGQTNRFGPVAVTSGSVITFRAAVVTVRLTGGSGTLDAASVAHLGNDGYWVGDGNTNGSGTVSFKVLPGTYTFSADYRGQTNQQTSVDVVGDRNVDFALATATVRLVNGPATMAAASVAHLGSDGYWVGDGNTSASGTVSFFVLPSTTYTMSVDFQGHTVSRSGITVATSGSTIDFSLTAVTVRLTNGGGSLASASVAHLGSDGYWVGDTATNSSGTSTFYLLPGASYTFSVDFRGQTNSRSNVTVSGATTTVDFSLTTVLVRLKGIGVTFAASSIAHLGNDGYWVGDGNTDASGQLTIVMLPSNTYTFSADFSGSTVQLTNTAVSGSTTTVEFQLSTLTVHVTHNGKDWNNVPVSLLGSDGYWVSIGNTDNNGLLTVQLVAGNYTVSSTRGVVTVSKPTAVPGATVELPF